MGSGNWESPPLLGFGYHLRALHYDIWAMEMGITAAAALHYE